jgi:type I restriction-modification system DNA methylase subunit
MTSKFDVEYDESGKVIDFLSKKILEPTAEENVRQSYLRTLHYEYSYPLNWIAREVAIISGSKQATDSQGNPIFADIIVYNSSRACTQRDQGNIRFIVECKAPNQEKGYSQLVSYIFNTSADGGVWFNGATAAYYRRFIVPSNRLVDWTGIPSHGEAWDALGQRHKCNLVRPQDIRGLLRQCHNKLHGRGVDGDEEDLTLDMVRIILAKALDEERPGDLCEFYCTPEELCSKDGRDAAASRVRQLFQEVASENSEVFTDQEAISVGPRAICDVVVELQRYRLLSDLGESHDWDLMGHAYEQYTSTYLKRTKGQFFTNRFIVDFMCAVLDPDYNDIVLDPAGGSGGFLTGTMRYVRRKILSSTSDSIARQRQLDKHRNNLFMVEISKRLVKIAKTAMILNGDGHTGMTQGDSLSQIDDLHERVKSRCGQEKPTKIITNPPFAGVGEGRVSDKEVLRLYRTGHKWTRINDQLIQSETLSEGVPPEMLFFEKCIQWISPGGRVGIVMPKSFLDTSTYLPIRTILMKECRVLAVINCHKNTFQPHTGVRTCLVIFEKKRFSNDACTSDSIFMAISRKIGQDSEGKPIYKLDSNNQSTNDVDHDLEEILRDYHSFQSSSLEPSEYRFSVPVESIDENINLNPQFYLPNLNEAIKRLEKIDDLDGWSISTLSQICPGVQIFKGPRIKTENLIVEFPGDAVEPYYTPTAILQEKSDSIKLLDISKATLKQLKAISAVRVHSGDIVVTRSGSIGRVAFITDRLDGAIVSDDLIRIRIPDDDLRFYVFAFLTSESGFAQMIRNEYGAVQQHLEPIHLQNLIIPMPANISAVSGILAAARSYIRAKSESESLLSELDISMSAFIADIA